MTRQTDFKTTIVGVIPKDWDALLLDALAKRGSGHTPNKKHPEYWDGDIKWISLRDSDRLDSLYIHETAAHITPEGIANSSATVHPAGTVVLSRDAGVGKSAIMASSMAVSQHFMAWQCGPRLNNRFLFYWLQSQKSEFERIAAGNTIKTIGLPYFKQLHVPVPKYEEQEAVANALEDIDVLISGLDQLLAKKRAIKLAAMLRLITKQRRLPGFSAPWVTKRFGDIFEFLRTAHNPRSDLSDVGSVGYVHYGDIHTRTSAFLDCSTVSMPHIDHAKVADLPLLQDGDVVMADASEDYAGIGKWVEVCRVASQKVVAGLHTFLLRGHEDDLAHGFKGYLQYVPEVRASLARLATGISVYGVSKNNVRTIEVQLPPPDEQRAIATVLSDMDAEIAALETHRAKTIAIKQGMMQELLTGRVRLV